MTPMHISILAVAAFWMPMTVKRVIGEHGEHHIINELEPLHSFVLSERFQTSARVLRSIAYTVLIKRARSRESLCLCPSVRI